jgi:hypothetical protein
MAVMFVIVDADSAQMMLRRIMSRLSPIAMAAWMHAVVGPYLRERAQARFASEGDDVVGKWAPLAPATVHIRETSGYGGAHPINVRTTELEQYITGGDPLVVATAGDALMTWPGSPPSGDVLEQKVVIAQVGDRRTPARPVVGINERDLMFVLSALSVYVGNEPGMSTVTGGGE